MAVETKQRKLTFPGFAGFEPGLLEASGDALFTDPLDGAYIPQLQHVQRKRFPGLATLRRMASQNGDSTYSAVHAQQGFHSKACVGCADQKDEVESAANASAREQQLPPTPVEGTHLAGAAVLGLRSLAGGADDSSAYLQQTSFTPTKMMMRTVFLDAAEAVTVSKAIKAPTVPRPPSAAPRPRAMGQGKRPTRAFKAPIWPRPPSEAPRPRAAGQGKRPIPSNVQAIIVPVIC